MFNRFVAAGGAAERVFLNRTTVPRGSKHADAGNNAVKMGFYRYGARCIPMAHILPFILRKGGRKLDEKRGLTVNLILGSWRGRRELRGKKLVVFAVAFVAFAAFFYLLDHGLQSWQGLELFPSGEH